MDTLTKIQRSYNMSKIRAKNTTIELLFRKYLWKNNIRGYRIHSKMTGKPDLYFARNRMAVFIDGCFWHKCPKHFVQPKSNLTYWNPKIERNLARASEINQMLQNSSIYVIRIWEHEIKENINIAYKKIRSSISKNVKNS